MPQEDPPLKDDEKTPDQADVVEQATEDDVKVTTIETAVVGEISDALDDADDGSTNQIYQELINIISSDQSSLFEDRVWVKFLQLSLALQKKVMIKEAERNPIKAFAYADKYKDQPYAKEIMMTAAEQGGPVYAFVFADKYKDQPYAKEIMMNSLKQDPALCSRSALEHADQYKDQSYAKEIIMSAAHRSPGYALEFADQYKDQPYAKEILIKAADRDPRLAFIHADQYKDQSYAKEIIMTAAKRSPACAFAYADQYKDQPYAQEIIMSAAYHSPRYALEFADKYKDQPYAKEVIMRASGQDPGLALKYADKYKDSFSVKEIVLGGLQRYIIKITALSDDIALKQAEKILDSCKGVEAQFGENLSKLKDKIEQNFTIWNDLIYPTIISQQIGAYLCLEDFQSINLRGEKAVNLLRYITTQMGIKAHDILQNFIMPALNKGTIEDLGTESKMIRDFLAEAIPIPEIYKAYKISKKGGEVNRYRELVETTNGIQKRIADGNCDEKDFDNQFFPALQMYTFPPATTVERSLYERLIRNRQDRQRDVPKSLEEQNLQGYEFEVSKGGYKIREGESLDTKSWSILFEIAQEVKEAPKEIDEVELGKQLMEGFANNRLRKNQKELLTRLYEVSLSQGRKLPLSLSTHEDLMDYKEFVGDTLNDIINRCVKLWSGKSPEEWRLWQERNQSEQQKSIKGFIK